MSNNTVFVCLKCGNCCRCSGTVSLYGEEAAKIASFLGISEEEFNSKYTDLDASRRGLRLKDQPGGTECIFLSKSGECVVQLVKPAQCRTFPIQWKYDGYEAICEAKKKERESQI